MSDLLIEAYLADGASVLASDGEEGPPTAKELAALREWYATCLRFLDHPDPARRGEAGRKAAKILRRARA